MIKNFWRWHPKVALRYLPIVQKIRKLKIENPAILEIGSGSLGIVPYLGKSATGVDLDFSGPTTDLLTKVRGSALNLPFKDRSFTVVVMVDVLEHIVPKERLLAVKEAFRVAKQFLVIALPCGREAYKEDKFLANYYEKIYHKKHSFFQEHLQYGLPEYNWVNDTIKQVAEDLGREIEINIQGNVNLSLHRFLMKGWITQNTLVDLIFRKVFLVLIPFFRLLNKEPTYRKIFYIEFKS